jgi:hypothetical protein
MRQQGIDVLAPDYQNTDMDYYYHKYQQELQEKSDKQLCTFSPKQSLLRMINNALTSLRAILQRKK